MGWFPTKLGSTGSGASNQLTAAELDVLDGVTAGTTAAGKVVTTAAATNKVAAVDITDLKIGGTSVTATATQINKLATLTSSAAQLDAAVAGTPLVYRTSHTAAVVETGTAGICVPAVAGQSFCVLDIRMRARGGNAANATTVEVYEETSNEVFLSHVIADLTSGTWVGQKEGTPVITGITAGGMVVANKNLIVSATGGAGLDTCSHIDVIVVGYYTTT